MGKQEGFAGKILERIGRSDPRLFEATLQQLLTQKQLLEVIFENLQEGLIVTDRHLLVIVCNARARRWLGIPSRRRVVGDSLPKLINAPEIFRFIAQTDFTKVAMTECDFRFARPADLCLHLTSYPVEAGDGSVSSIVFVLRDVTEARKAELQQRQAEQIASLATLTAGIAHELKNPLNSLQIHAQLAGRMIDAVRDGHHTIDIERLEHSLHAVLEETRRMSRILDDFLGAVRPTDPEKVEVHPRSILEEVAEFFRRECEEKQIVLRVSCDPDMPAILLDDQQIIRALANIVRNAIEAIEARRDEPYPPPAPPRAGGIISSPPPEGRTLSSPPPAGGQGGEGDGSQSASDLITMACRVDGDAALIEISDTGCGIDAEHLNKVFEPHFTTKFSGSGLGLMNVYRIVREHDGRVDINSERGKGTRVGLHLPLTQRPIRLLTQEPAAPEPLCSGTDELEVFEWEPTERMEPER